MTIDDSINLCILGMGAMGQTMASMQLDLRRYVGRAYPKINLSLFEYNPMYHNELKKVLDDPNYYEQHLQDVEDGKKKRLFFNFGKFKDRISFHHPASGSYEDYKKSLEKAVDGQNIILISSSTEGLEPICQAIQKNVNEEAYIVSICKGIIESDTVKTTLATPYEIMEHYLPHSKIFVMGGANISPEIRKFLPAITTIISDSGNVSKTDMKKMRDLFTKHKFTVKPGENRLLHELLWAAKNPYAIGKSILDKLEQGTNISGDYFAYVLREFFQIYRAFYKERHPIIRTTHPYLMVAKSQFIDDAVGADLFTTCTSPDSRNYRTGQMLAERKTLGEIKDELGGQVAEGISSTEKLLKLFKNPQKIIPILYGVSRVIPKNDSEKGEDPKKVVDDIENQLRLFFDDERSLKLIERFRRKK